MNLNFNIDQIALMDKLESELGKEAAWTSFKTLIALSSPSSKSENSYTSHQVVTKTSRKHSRHGEVHSWFDKGLLVGYRVKSKKTGCIFRLKDPSSRRGGFEFLSKDGGDYLAPNLLSQMRSVTALSKHDSIRSGTKSAFDARQWVVLDGPQAGNTLFQVYRVAGIPIK